MDTHIPRLTGEDWAIYRELRLEALKAAPQAFGAALEDEEARDDQSWRQLLSGERAFFGGFIGEDLLGSVNFLQEQGEKVRHKSWLLGMYVSERARGTGLALALIEALIAHARAQKAGQVQLGVGVYNEPAQRLYRKAGFEIYGTEPRGLRVAGKDIDEHLMVRFLDEKK